MQSSLLRGYKAKLQERQLTLAVPGVQEAAQPSVTTAAAALDLNSQDLVNQMCDSVSGPTASVVCRLFTYSCFFKPEGAKQGPCAGWWVQVTALCADGFEALYK